MRTLLILIMAFMCTAATNIPASKDWKSKFWGGGGAFPAVAYDISVENRIYALSDVAGLSISLNNAGSWSSSNGGVKTAYYTYLKQSDKNENIIYMIGKKFMVSRNRGKNFDAVQDYSAEGMKSRQIIAPDRTDKEQVFVADKTGKIYHCYEYGSDCAIFAQPVTGASIGFLYVTPDNRYLIVGLLTGGMKRYDRYDQSSVDILLSGTNALRNWAYSTFVDDREEEYLCVAAGHNVRCTKDAGTTWPIVSADFITDANYFVSTLAAAWLPVGEARFVAYARQISTPYGTNYIKTSSDTGQTWSSDQSGGYVEDAEDPSNVWGSFGSVGNIFNFSINPYNPDEILASTDWRVLLSQDAGDTWEGKIRGSPNQVVTDCEVAPDDIGTTFCMGMDIGAYRSEDGLQTWEPILPSGDNPDPDGFDIAGHHWASVINDNAADWNAGNGTITIFTSQWTDFIPRVWVCDDNGDTCEQGTGLPTTQLYVPRWSSTTTYSPGQRVAVSDGVYESTLSSTGLSPDSGGNSGYWQLVRLINWKHAAAWGIGYPRSVTKAPDGKIYVCIDGYSATENGGVFVSSDDGRNFTRTTQPPGWKCYNGISADPTDPTGNTVVLREYFYQAPDAPHTYKTTDGGQTWQDGGAVEYGASDVKYNESGVAYGTGLKSGPYVYYSTDGLTWADLKQLNANENVIGDALTFDPRNPDVAFASANDATATGPGTGSGIPAGLYATANLSAGTGAAWHDITGLLDCPSGVHDLAVNTKYGRGGLLIAATDGCGVKVLDMSDTLPTKIINVK